jgi:hypothetical protein
MRCRDGDRAPPGASDRGSGQPITMYGRAGTDNASTRHLFGLDHCDVDVLKRREDARRNKGDKPTDMLGAS